MDVSIKALHKNVMEWMAGPVGSITMHVVIIIALVFLLQGVMTEKTSEIEVEVIEIDEKLLEDLQQELEPPPEMDTLVDAMDIPMDVNIDMEIPQEPQDFSEAPIMSEVVDLVIASDAVSPIVLKNLMPGAMQQRSGSGRAASIGQYGGEWGKAAEAAVLRALRWLKNNQNDNGSWGNSDKQALTALGILTYLAHGETTDSEDYGDVVQRALRFLVASQDENGFFVKGTAAAPTYAQAMCVYAISEAYSMTRIPSLRSVMSRGADVLIKGIQPNGGYDYGWAQQGRIDTSLAGWCCQALKAAEIAGYQHPKLKETKEKALAAMRSIQREDGAFKYSNAKSSPAYHNMTAVAVLSHQLLGHGGTDSVRQGLRSLADAECNWEKPIEWPMYGWYYIAQAKFHQGGSSWNRWNNQCAPVLIKNQRRSEDPKVDGSWVSAGVSLPKGTTGREDWGTAPPVYATTLAALTLQVYYRNLPTYKPVEEQVIEHTSSDDVTIEIL